MIHSIAIDHVCLLVSNIKQSQDYYSKVFGASCKLRENDPSTSMVETPHIHFFLSQSDADPSFFAKQHLSLRVASLEAVMSELQSLGIHDYETGETDFFEYENYRWCEWRDPDGIRLECVELLGQGNT